MPYVPTFVSGLGDALPGVGGDLFGQAIGGIADIIKALKGGGNGGVMTTGPSSGLSLGIPYYDLVPEGATCITPRATTSMRLPANVDVPKVDASGNVTFTRYKNMGRPVLYQGDLAACKRVRKVAGKARRAGGR